MFKVWGLGFLLEDRGVRFKGSGFRGLGCQVSAPEFLNLLVGGMGLLTFLTKAGPKFQNLGESRDLDFLSNAFLRNAGTVPSEESGPNNGTVTLDQPA